MEVQTDVEELADELWLEVKCHSNPPLTDVVRFCLLRIVVNLTVLKRVWLTTMHNGPKRIISASGGFSLL